MKVHVIMLFIVVIVLFGVHTEANMCTDTDLQVDYNGVTVQEIVRYGHYVDLKCCSHDMKEITWSKWNNHTNTWMTLDSEVDDVIFHHHGQIISINSVSFDDNGLYQCILQSSNSLETADRKFQLVVIPCDTLARGPFPIAPLPCSETTTEVESILTLPCSGYFGCGGKDDMRVVTWLVSPLDEESAWKPVANVDNKRYITRDFNREGFSIHGSNLTIHRVSSVDFKRKFMCVLASPQMVKGESRIVVKLKNEHAISLDTASISTQRVVIVVTVSSILVLIALSISSVAIYKLISAKREEQNRATTLISTRWKSDHSDEFSV